MKSEGLGKRGIGVPKPAILHIPVVLIVVILIVLTGCETRQGVNIGDNPPGISGNDIHGEYVSLSKLKGKVVLIYFWTNSCCGGSVKQISPLYNQYQYDGLEIIAINELDSVKDVASFARSNALAFTMLTDEHSLLFKQYRAFGFPTIFILDRNGIVREKVLGDIQPAKLESLVAAYLGNKTPQKTKEPL